MKMRFKKTSSYNLELIVTYNMHTDDVTAMPLGKLLNMTWIATSPTGAFVLFQDGVDFYLITKNRVRSVQMGDALVAWAEPYKLPPGSVRWVSKEPERKLTARCPECGCVAPFTRWDSSTGEKVHGPLSA